MHITLNSPIIHLLAGYSLFRWTAAQAARPRSHTDVTKYIEAHKILPTPVLAARDTTTTAASRGGRYEGPPIPRLDRTTKIGKPYAQRYPYAFTPERSELCIPRNYYTTQSRVQFDENYSPLEVTLGAICEERCDRDPLCQAIVVTSDGPTGNHRYGEGICYFYADTFVYPDKCQSPPRFFSAYYKPDFTPIGFASQAKCTLSTSCGIPGGPVLFAEQSCFPKEDVCVPPNHYHEVKLPGIERPFEPKLTEQCQLLCEKHSRCQSVLGTIKWGPHDEELPYASCYLYDRSQLFPRTCSKPAQIGVAYSKQKQCPRIEIPFDFTALAKTATIVSTAGNNIRISTITITQGSTGSSSTSISRSTTISTSTASHTSSSSTTSSSSSRLISSTTSTTPSTSARSTASTTSSVSISSMNSSISTRSTSSTTSSTSTSSTSSASSTTPTSSTTTSTSSTTSTSFATSTASAGPASISNIGMRCNGTLPSLPATGLASTVPCCSRSMTSMILVLGLALTIGGINHIAID